jgi:uncharacterized integral membrane protein
MTTNEPFNQDAPNSADPLSNAELRQDPVEVIVKRNELDSNVPILKSPTPAIIQTPSGESIPVIIKPIESEALQRQVSNQDYSILRYAVVGLVVAISITIFGDIYLLANDKSTPTGLLAIGSAAVGALATMLVKPPLNK